MPHPSESVLRAAESSLAASADFFSALADADVNATESDSEDAREARGEEAKSDRERRESRPAARPRRPRSDVHDRDPSGGATRARLESLVAADHTLANQSTPVPGSVDPEDVGAALAPGDVVRYRYRVSGDRRGETLGASAPRPPRLQDAAPRIRRTSIATRGPAGFTALQGLRVLFFFQEILWC